MAIDFFVFASSREKAASKLDGRSVLRVQKDARRRHELIIRQGAAAVDQCETYTTSIREGIWRYGFDTRVGFPGTSSLLRPGTKIRIRNAIRLGSQRQLFLPPCRPMSRVFPFILVIPLFFIVPHPRLYCPIITAAS